MAGQIRITPDQMRSRASEYRTEASNVGDVISKMDTLLNELQEEWEGEASRAYESRFEELRPSFVKAQDLINEIAQSLDATAQSLEETDQNIASQFRG
jgi:WXG100 family type VII secretion target